MTQHTTQPFPTQSLNSDSLQSRTAAALSRGLGSFIDTVLRGMERMVGGLFRPALKPIPVRVSLSPSRRRRR